VISTVSQRNSSQGQEKRKEFAEQGAEFYAKA